MEFFGEEIDPLRPEPQPVVYYVSYDARRKRRWKRFADAHEAERFLKRVRKRNPTLVRVVL